MSINADTLINTIKDAAKAQLKLGVEQVKALVIFLETNRQEMADAIASGDPGQAGVVSFRIHGQARDSAVEQIKAGAQRIWDIAFGVLAMAIEMAGQLEDDE